MLKWIRRRVRRMFWLLGALLRLARSTRWERHVTQALGQVRAGYDNASFNMTSNGETWLLERMATLRPKVLLDVGANCGEWSLKASDHCDSATIHAFEPVPDTATRLAENVHHNVRIYPHAEALSSTSEPLQLWVPEVVASSAVATAYPVALTGAHQHTRGRWIEVPARRGTDLFADLRFEKIDLLKIDAEGFDLEVLWGFGDALRSVRIIQFEYAAFAVKPGFFLYHYYMLLESYGFCIGRLFPRRVHVMPYSFSQESIHGGIFVAFQQDDAQVRQLLT